jgi:predicted MFS family arabinose efflux permease
MAGFAHRYLRMKAPKEKDDDTEGDATVRQEKSLLQIVRRIALRPAFSFLVAQGVFGAIPWDMMSFVLLLMEWKHFSKEEIVKLQFAAGVCGTIGSPLGGYLGDLMAQRQKRVGRIGVAFVSVCGGIVLWSLFLMSDVYHWALLWYSLFHLVGTWTRAAAIRPVSSPLLHFDLLVSSTNTCLCAYPPTPFLPILPRHSTRYVQIWRQIQKSGRRFVQIRIKPCC